MRTFKIEIELENDDFIEHGETYVVAWILDHVVMNMRDHGLPSLPVAEEEARLFDVNGNPCGKMGVENVID